MKDLAEPHELLEAIERWYVQNGSTSPIPNSAKTPFGEAFNGYSEHSISYGGCELQEISGNVLPLLAGIKLGFSQSALKEIILHHDIQLENIERISYNDDEDTNIVLKRNDGTSCSKTEFIATTFQALAQVESRHRNMPDLCDSWSIIQIGLMHTDNEYAWPAHHIKARAASAQKPPNGRSEAKELSDYNYAFIISNLDSEGALPNRSPMDFLNRAGMLLPEAAKRATAHYTFWEEMAELSMKGNSCCTKILEFCAKHKNPAVKKSIKQALLSLGGYEFMEEPGKMFNHLKSIFDNSTYRETFGKVIPRINLVPYDTSDFLAHFPDDPKYCDFLRKKETLLSVVANEILELPSKELGYSQLHIFSKLKYLELPAQRVDGFNPEALLNHMLDGLNSYVAKIPLLTCHKKLMDTEVKGSLADLVTLIQLNHEIDYTKFEHRTSSEKSLLVESGFPIKEMTGLTYQDKAHIFRDELNI